MKNNELKLRLTLRLRYAKSELRSAKWRILVLALYIIICLIVWGNKYDILYDESAGAFAYFLYRLYCGALLTWMAVLLLFLLRCFSRPIGAVQIESDLIRAGMTNSAGEPPILLRKKQDRQNPRILILEFESRGIPLSQWMEHQEAIEGALNVHIDLMELSPTNCRHVILHMVPGSFAFPKKLQWTKDKLSPDGFTLVLGETLTGTATIDLSCIPHILIGGSTGSGKSVLLKCLLMQALKKNARIYIADFKGGVDFAPIWHKKCKMCFDEAELLPALTEIVEELNRRKQELAEHGIPNIDAYNCLYNHSMPRIIFACDEVAELLDCSGLPKEEKAVIMKIEAKIATIARLGRAFGIHLILATQRPSAELISGQIRNNVDCRICGRADQILSQIILGNTSAAERIPRNAQGRFLLPDGTLFQGYLFDENTELEGAEWKK